MTAIAGYWSFGEAAGSERLCGSMLSAQALYGSLTSEQLCVPGLAMGRRLFLLFPEDRQGGGVAKGGEGDFYLTGDLRIDNRGELAAALGQSRLAGAPDLEILKHCLEKWSPEETLARLEGDFAFALWDRRRRRLTLARDFLGQRPLHYHVGKDFVAFASMPKGLHALPNVERAPDREALMDFLVLLPEPRSGSFFRGINSVPAGHIVEIEADGVRETEYWKPNLDPLILADAGAYEEAFLAHYDESVRARLRGAGDRVATHLSSGLDSSTVTATAARIMNEGGGRVTAFTAVPASHAELSLQPGEIGNEGELAAQAASFYPNIDHVRVECSGRSPLDNLDRLFSLFERPPLNPVNHTWIDAINDEAARRGLNILLTGQKGNMSVSYSGLTRPADLLRRGKFMAWGKLFNQLRRAGMRPRAVLGRSVVPLLPRTLWRLYAKSRSDTSTVAEYSLIDPELFERERVQERAEAAEHDLLYQPKSDGQRTRLAALRGVDMGNYNKGMLAGWGIDYRDPTADRRLVEFCLRVPEEFFVTDGVPRSLIRRAFKGRLPEAILDNRKLGVQAADWSRGIAAAKNQFVAAAERIEALDPEYQLVDLKRIVALVREWPDKDWHQPLTRMMYQNAIPRAISATNFARHAANLN